MSRPALTSVSVVVFLSIGCGGPSEADEVANDEVDASTTGAEIGDSTTGAEIGDSTTSDSTTSDSTTSDSTTTPDSDTTDTTDTTTGDGDPDIDLTFVAFGDAGEGSAEQYAVGAAVEVVCADKDCAFVLYLGDNFYDDGVASAMDEQFQTKFELPYADLDLPFKVVLGNHDYGVLSFAWEKAAYEIEYSNYSDKWELPSEYYTLEYPGVDLFVFDTTQFMWNHNTAEQQTWIDQQIAASTATWKIVAGHHPYYSNGEHGNAGSYEGFPFPPQLAGTTVKNVLDESMCGKVDVYLSGHDHNRQWLKPTCQGTSIIVSGAGAKTTDFAYHGGGNEVWWEDDTKPGFMLVHVTNTTMHTEFYDSDGVMEFERDIVK